MTSPEPVEPRPEYGEAPAPRPRQAAPRRQPSSLTDNPVVDWARAIGLGIRDTAREMLEAGRKSAETGYDEGWKRFDKKTKYRRKANPNAPPPKRKRDK